MNPGEVVARERRRATPAAVAAFASVIVFIVAIAINQSAAPDSRTDSQFLISFNEDSGTLLIASILQAAGLLLVTGPLMFMFSAVAARSEAVRPSLIGIVIAGPLFLAVGTVLQWVAFDNAATEFARPGGGAGIPVGEYTEDLIREQGVFDAAQGFTFAGTLGFVVAVVYTSLHAMRTGLLTRFWGSLGMALGVSVLFLGFLGILVLIVAFGLLIAGLWPGGRPAAWDAGRAIPWPKSGESSPAEDAGEEAAEPARVGEPSTGSAVDSSGSDGSPEPAPRKRKRRQ